MNTINETQIRELILLAAEARENSYSPYSNFMVGAALLAKSGKIYKGCNIESCSYSPTTCAERVALFKAVSEGEREFSAIAVIGGPASGIDPAAPEAAPCGVCRQMIYEFGSDIQVICAKSPDDYYILPISELLPHGFGPSNLG